MGRGRGSQGLEITIPIQSQLRKDAPRAEKAALTIEMVPEQELEH